MKDAEKFAYLYIYNRQDKELHAGAKWAAVYRELCRQYSTKFVDNVLSIDDEDNTDWGD